MTAGTAPTPPVADLRAALRACPLIAILRGLTPAHAPAVGAALVDHGFAVLEVPMNSPQPVDSIRLLAAAHPLTLVGAGTVMTTAEVDAVAGAGGRLIVMPHADLTIVRHAAYRWLRKNRPSALVSVADLDALADTQPGQTPEAALIAKADAARLEQAIAALPVPFRETLVLRDVNGLDYRAIAGVTGVPIGTVMSRLARARSRLIAALGVDEP